MSKRVEDGIDGPATSGELPFHGWEYRLVSSGTVLKGGMMATLNRLGRAGWEIIGFAAADKTLGLNSLEVLLKRPLLADGQVVPATDEPLQRPVKELTDVERVIHVPDDLPESEFLCVECSSPVPTSADACPSCGWSWV